MGTNLQGGEPTVTTYEDILKRRAERSAAGKAVFEPENEVLPTEDEIIRGIESRKKPTLALFDVEDDPPLPAGYSFRQDRKVDFLSNEHSTGIDGLCWSILLTAVADGCNPAWLREIIDYYQIDTDPDLLYRHPVATGIMKNNKGRFIRADDLRAKVKRVRVASKILGGLDIPKELVHEFSKRYNNTDEKSL